METLAAQPTQEHQLNQELRIRTDTVTWLAEALNGNMRTSFEFSSDEQELYGEDGGGLTEVFDDSIRAAKLITQENPSLKFELRRRLIERGELEEMKAMTNGQLGDTNTIVVISDFPPELMASQASIGGYNVQRKQTMLRVITLTENGTTRVTTQSLDGSDRRALESIYRSLGKEAKPGELLQQRIHLNLSAQGQDRLADSLTGVYDDALAHQRGGKWKAGRPGGGGNTYEFAAQQADLIGWFTDQVKANPAVAKQLLFQLAATAEARYERYLKGESIENLVGGITAESLINPGSIAAGKGLQVEMFMASQRAASLGKTYNGCGASASAEAEEQSVSEQLNSSGYGNKSKTEKDVMRCVNCPKCRTYHEQLKARGGHFTCQNKKCGYSVKA